MLKLLSWVENVQQIVWPRFQEQLTVIEAVGEVEPGKFTAPPPMHNASAFTTIELKSIKKSTR